MVQVDPLKYVPAGQQGTLQSSAQNSGVPQTSSLLWHMPSPQHSDVIIVNGEVAVFLQLSVTTT